MKRKEKIIIASFAIAVLVIPMLKVLKSTADLGCDLNSVEIQLPEGNYIPQSTSNELSYIEIDSSQNGAVLIEQSKDKEVQETKSNSRSSSEDLKKLILSLKRH